MAMKLNHLHLKTRDPEKTAAFYVEILGARIVKQSAKGGYRLDLHGLVLNVSKFYENHAREQTYGMEHLAINTDEYETLMAMLKRNGVKILEEHIKGSGYRECFFAGPDGVQFELIEMKSGK